MAALQADARYRWMLRGVEGFGTGRVGRAAAGSSLSFKVRPQLLVWKGVQGLGGVAQTSCDCLKFRGQTSALLILNVEDSEGRLFLSDAFPHGVYNLSKTSFSIWKVPHYANLTFSVLSVTY